MGQPIEISRMEFSAAELRALAASEPADAQAEPRVRVADCAPAGRAGLDLPGRRFLFAA